MQVEFVAHLANDHVFKPVSIIPYRVILNEAVELAKTFGAEHGHRYVNAVLDKVAAELRPQEMTGAHGTASAATRAP